MGWSVKIVVLSTKGVFFSGLLGHSGFYAYQAASRRGVCQQLYFKSFTREQSLSRYKLIIFEIVTVCMDKTVENGICRHRSHLKKHRCLHKRVTHSINGISFKIFISKTIQWYVINFNSFSPHCQRTSTSRSTSRSLLSGQNALNRLRSIICALCHNNLLCVNCAIFVHCVICVHSVTLCTVSYVYTVPHCVLCHMCAQCHIVYCVICVHRVTIVPCVILCNVSYVYSVSYLGTVSYVCSVPYLCTVSYVHCVILCTVSYVWTVPYCVLCHMCALCHIVYCVICVHCVTFVHCVICVRCVILCVICHIWYALCQDISCRIMSTWMGGSPPDLDRSVVCSWISYPRCVSTIW